MGGIERRDSFPGVPSTSRTPPGLSLPYPTPQGAGPPGVEPRQLLQLLWDKKWRILLSAIAAGIAAFAIATIMPRKYTAEGLMVVNTQEINIPDFQTIRSIRSQGSEDLWNARSAALVLTSREVIERTARVLDLEADPVFNRELEKRAEESADASAASEGAEGELSPFDKMITNIRRNLDVVSAERSYAINVDFTWGDPQAAAKFVNALMRQYIADEAGKQRTLTAEANERLQQQGNELHAALAATQARIREIENTSDLVETGLGGSVVAQRLLSLSQEQRTVENDLTRVRADLEQLSAAITAGNANLLNPELVTPRLRALLESEAEERLRERMGRTVDDLGPKHPEALAVQAQRRQLQREVGSELESIRTSLRMRLNVLQSRQVELAKYADKIGTEAAGIASRRTELEQLREQAASQQRLYDIYQERYRQTLANLEVLQPQIRIAAQALPPVKPSSPGRTLLALVGAVLGGLAAIAVIVGRRWWLGRLQSPAEVTAVTGLPVLGVIPWIKSSSRGSDQPGLGPLITESVRGILFRLPSSGTSGTAVQICSALPGEGKTTLTLALARVAASDGLRALCIDADFRNPTLLQRARTTAEFTVNDVLNGTCDIHDAIQADSLSGAHIMGARVEEGTRPSHVGLLHFQTLLRYAKAEYDIVFVDSSPVLRVVDPLLISRLADGVVLVVSEKSASTDRVCTAVERFIEADAPLAGLVVADDPKRMPERYAYPGYHAAQPAAG